MKIKFFILFFAFCLLLCACSNAGGTDTTVADTTAADTTESSENIQETEGETTSKPTVPSESTEGVPSLTIEEDTTEEFPIFLPTVSDEPIRLPDLELDNDYPPSVVTTVPDSLTTEAEDDTPVVTDRPTSPEEELDDDIPTTADAGLVLPDDEFGE